MKAIGDIIKGMNMNTTPEPPGEQSPEEREAEWKRQEEERRKEQTAYYRRLRKKRFLSLCPPLYQNTDAARLPQDKLNAVTAWQYNPTGLLLVGKTGAGKTRCAWQLMRRLIIREDKSVKHFDGLGWGLAVSAAFGNPQEAEHWIDGVCKADVLFLDDLFKAKMTEAQEQAIYGVFERRAAHLKPIITTMNTTGDMLLARMTETGRADRGEPLIRRMREFCQIITF
jgi:DNA replication protein DnaC